MNRSYVRLITTLIIAGAIFIAAILLPKLLVQSPVGHIATTQGLELILALGAIALLGRGKFADYGFRLPNPAGPGAGAKRHWLLFGAMALALGMAATLAMLISGASGNPIIKKLSFPQIILFVWIFSSTIEEIFTRGFIQSHLSCWSTTRIPGPWPNLTLPTLISALAFASMHLVLLVSGADLTSVAIIWLFTFSVGLLAGYQRHITGSLLPAIGVHMLANIGGMLGGILYVIIRVMSGGSLPTP